jgi:hypothetical protein
MAGVEMLARRKDTIFATALGEDLVEGLNHSRRGNGINILSLGGHPAQRAALADFGFYQEGLRRAAGYIGGDRRRRAGVAEIAQRRGVQIGV